MSKNRHVRDHIAIASKAEKKHCRGEYKVRVEDDDSRESSCGVAKVNSDFRNDILGSEMDMTANCAAPTSRAQ